MSMAHDVGLWTSDWTSIERRGSVHRLYRLLRRDSIGNRCGLPRLRTGHVTERQLLWTRSGRDCARAGEHRYLRIRTACSEHASVMVLIDRAEDFLLLTKILIRLSHNVFILRGFLPFNSNVCSNLRSIVPDSQPPLLRVLKWLLAAGEWRLGAIIRTLFGEGCPCVMQH